MICNFLSATILIFITDIVIIIAIIFIDVIVGCRVVVGFGWYGDRPYFVAVSIKRVFAFTRTNRPQPQQAIGRTRRQLQTTSHKGYRENRRCVTFESTLKYKQ
jgi:hypothetical protein